MLRLLMQCIVWSVLGRILRLTLKVPIIFSKSLNDYLSYIEAIWHYDSPKLFKTIYFNFRVCSFKYALLCPIYIYGKTRIWSLNGHVFFECDNVKSGMIKWGYDWGYRSNGVTIIRIQGNLYFKGSCLFAKASDVAIFSGATLVIGSGAEILENSIIYCTNNITIGANFSFTFQSSMMDTDFHYVVDITQKKVSRKSAPILIGDNVWIGNRATIKKGVIIPNNTIVAASYSVLTKDYSVLPPYSIIGGCPAKLLVSGYSRIWKNEIENMNRFDTFFLDNPDVNYLELEEGTLFDYIYECK